MISLWSAELQPKLFGWFHILGILFAIAAGYGGVLLGRKFKDNKKGVSVCLWTAEITLIVLEVAKEIFYAIENGGYRWDMFPMQICSIIVFVLPVVMFIKDGTLKDSILGFLGFCSLAGAIFYFCNPTAAFNTPYVLLSVHSFLWHWIMIATGTFIIVVYGLLGKKKLKLLVGAYAVWFVFAVIAAVANNVAYAVSPELNIDYYHIGYVKVVYPILNIFFKTPEPYTYIPFFLCFMVYFALGTVGIYYAAKGVEKLNHKIFRK
ncbi:MAG: YwaF family protein [Clostridia bacterium]|nr:YwaF family protein [Clostridia bacterium]MDY2901135.1 YwaF family protein [Christensenellaceae bacterium]